MIQPKLLRYSGMRTGKGTHLFLTSRLAAAKALLLTAGALFVLTLSAADSRAAAPGSCEDAAELAVLPSPIAPWKGAPLRVVFAAEKPFEGELSLIAPDGSVAAKSHERRGGPPISGTQRSGRRRQGRGTRGSRASAHRPECSTLNYDIAVLDDEPPRPHGTPRSVWPVRNTWNRATENLFSAWIEKLFDAPLDAALSWPALHEVLRDRSRNILFNHLGLGEDQMGPVVRPDCADLPYFLRAYFAFKMGLPFGYSKCSRGGGGKPPSCHEWSSIQNSEQPRAAPTEPKIASGVAARRCSARPVARRPALPPRATRACGVVRLLFAATSPTASIPAPGERRGSDDNTDYYPVPLKQETLRPGTVYADPYGHFGVARRVPQSSGAAGVFLAVDGQPDGTVARKRFWRGNFLFAQDPALGGPGFKRFRPIVADKNGGLRRLTNEEIAKNPQYARFLARSVASSGSTTSTTGWTT